MTHKPEPMTPEQIDKEIERRIDPVATYPKLHSFARAIVAARDAQWGEATKQLREDAERWRHAVADGGNQSMNFMDIYSDWDGDGNFTAYFDAAMKGTT